MYLRVFGGPPGAAAAASLRSAAAAAPGGPPKGKRGSWGSSAVGISGIEKPRTVRGPYSFAIAALRHQELAAWAHRSAEEALRAQMRPATASPGSWIGQYSCTVLEELWTGSNPEAADSVCRKHGSWSDGGLMSATSAGPQSGGLDNPPRFDTRNAAPSAPRTVRVRYAVSTRTGRYASSGSAVRRRVGKELQAQALTPSGSCRSSAGAWHLPQPLGPDLGLRAGTKKHLASVSAPLRLRQQQGGGFSIHCRNATRVS